MISDRLQAGRFRFTPYGSGELYYDRNHHSWNQNQYGFGMQFPYKKRLMLDTYLLHQNCTSCSQNPVNMIGATLNLYFRQPQITISGQRCVRPRASAAVGRELSNDVDASLIASARSRLFSNQEQATATHFVKKHSSRQTHARDNRIFTVMKLGPTKSGEYERSKCRYESHDEGIVTYGREILNCTPTYRGTRLPR